MTRRKMGLAEAIKIFGLQHPGCKVTKELIGKTFRTLCFSVHTDKNKSISKKESGEMIGKFTEAKKTLLANFDAIPFTSEMDCFRIRFLAIIITARFLLQEILTCINIAFPVTFFMDLHLLSGVILLCLSYKL